MKFLHKVVTSTAALSIALGGAVLPAAQAAQAFPANNDGKFAYSAWETNGTTFADSDAFLAAHGNDLATVTKHDIYATMDGTDGSNNGQGYWQWKDPNGAKTEENIAKSADGKLETTLPEKLTWLTTVYNRYRDSKNLQYWTATSPAMGGREVNLAVVTPTGNFDQSRPTIYLLNGAGGADQGMDYVVKTGYRGVERTLSDGTTTVTGDINENVVEFYMKKNVNLVIVQDGAFTYYSDWQQSPQQNYLTDEKLAWETFLTKELPPVLENKDNLNGNGKRAIAGMSMAATSSLLLAEHNPGFYDAVGSYSGCADTTTPAGRLYVNLTVNRGGGSADQMWGPRTGDYGRYNDALINSNNLAKSKLYVSVSTGIPDADSLGSVSSGSSGSSGSSNLSTLVQGVAIEAAMHDCTVQLKRKLDSENIQADWNFRATGIHSWAGWYEDNWKSWNTYAKAFGQPEGYDRDPNIGVDTTASALSVDDQISVPAQATDTAADNATTVDAILGAAPTVGEAATNAAAADAAAAKAAQDEAAATGESAGGAADAVAQAGTADTAANA